MRATILLALMTLVGGCAGYTPYAWQDTRQPAREDYSADLEVCMDFATRQYRPGMPSGMPYLGREPDDTAWAEDTSFGEWRPDRDPFPAGGLSYHGVPVVATGYPGELDHHPGYLDAILEKCMLDRGWEYRPLAGSTGPDTTKPAE